MTLREIARTNKPQTCLWCGQRLSERSNSKDRPATAKETALWRRLTAEREAAYETAKEEETWEATVKLQRKADNTRERLFKREFPNVRMWTTGDGFSVSESHGNGTWGPYGDGFFCTLACGFSFGRAAAENGYRFKPTT